jgi:hypothetical protein
MTFEQAIVKSVRAYFKGKDPQNLMDVAEGKALEDDADALNTPDAPDTKTAKYTRSFMEELEASLLEPEPKTKKSKAATKVEDVEDTEDVEAAQDAEDAPLNGLLVRPKNKKGK